MKERFPLSKQIYFAIGQLGWSILMGLINSYLIYFYSAPEDAGIPKLIPQGTVLGFLTIIGLITMAGRFLDAITDPWIATLSDRCQSPKGRRISFMGKAAIPLAIFTVLIFWTPFRTENPINVIWLAFALFAFYILYTLYVTPYNALISELGQTPEERLNISTYISVTFFLGMALASQAALIWNIFIDMGMEKLFAIQFTFAILATIALICLLVPVLTIEEKRYCKSIPSELDMMESLKATFKNKDFLVFAISDLAYFLALTVLTTGLMYYITVLLWQEEALYSQLFIVLGVASFLFYPFVNLTAKKAGKKKMLIIAFLLFTLVYILVFVLGKDFVPMSNRAQAYGIVLLSALPMAIFGILPNAILSDIAEYDGITTGNYREAIFFGARTFMSKVGQMLSMLVFSSLLLLGKDRGNDLGIRLSGPVAAIFCVIGLVFFLMYDEKKILGLLRQKQIFKIQGAMKK